MATDEKLSELVPEITTPASGDRYYVVRGTTSYFIDNDNLPGGGLSNIVEDTTPQLGGNLDLNGNVITGLEIGTNIQAYDADLAAIAALTPTKGNLLIGNGSAWIAVSVGSNDQVLTADSAQASGIKWAASAGGGATLTIDTRANILATASPSSGDMYYAANDSEEFLIYDGADFQAQPLEFQATSTAPDMGLQPPTVVNDLAGYSDEYITDKLIANSRIGSNANTTEGSIRATNGTAAIYLNSTWADIVTNLRFREDSVGEYELEHRPIGFTDWYEVSTGNSDDLDVNGTPMHQEYKTDMGAVQSPIVIRSRAIS